MVRKLSISPTESDLSLATEDEKETKEADPLSSNYPTWSSRLKCLEAYVCMTMSFTSVMQHCETIGFYGILAFIPYTVCALLIGTPIAFVELLLGRYVMGNVVNAWAMCPLAKGILICLFGTTTYTVIVNNVSIIYFLKYLFSFYHGYIPWDKCREPWAKENCYVIGKNSSAFLNCVQNHSESYCRNLTWESSGVQFWKYMTRQNLSLHEVALTTAFLVLSVVLIVLINFKGHQSCEKVFIVLVYLPLINSLIMTYAAYSSIGKIAAINMPSYTNWNLIFDLKTWLVISEDFLLSLGLGTLAFSVISSHGKFKDNIFLDILMVIFTNIFTSTLLAIPILSMIKDLKHKKKKYINISFTGKLDIFLWMSESLLHYPTPNVLWAFLFYLQMLLMSFGTQTIMVLSLCEVIASVFKEPTNYFYISILVGLVSFALSIPYFFISFDFEYPLQTIILTIILLYAITWQRFYGIKKFHDDCHFMLGYQPSFSFLRLHWILMIPMITVFLTLKMIYKLPHKPLKHMVFIYVSIPLVLYLATAVVQIVRYARRGDISKVFAADPDWGPDNSILKLSRIIFNARTVTKEFMYRQQLYRKPLLKPPDFSEQNIVQLI